ncbi:MAG: amidohydrolase family protein [Chloroflexi bacterium]|nr:amidohydrolase family protein [Chloroflexota bacterium]
MQAITGATLIDGTGRDPVQNATVLIGDDGRITSVGQSDQLPRGVEVIEVSGMTVMPGLIDCHVHLMIVTDSMQTLALKSPSIRVLEAADNARRTLDAGITSVRDAGGTPAGVKAAIARGLIPGPRMRIAVGVLTQTGGHGDFLLPGGMNHPFIPPTGTLEHPGTICDGPEDVRRSVREQLRAGADFIKMCTTGGVLSPGDELDATQFTREEISVMVYEAAAAGKTCMAHAMGPEGIRNAVEFGVESIEHGFYIDEETAQVMSTRGAFLVPTFQAPRAALRYEAANPGSMLPQSVEKCRAVMADQANNFRIAVEAGVKVAMGTDAGVGVHGENAEELRLLVEEGGLSPMEAIVVGTRNAAECAHIDGDVGTLVPGKLADLLVVDGDPLTDISVLEDRRNLKIIMQGGVSYKDVLRG